MIRVALLALALSGCSAIGHQKVEGWPELRVVEHHVPHRDMHDRCATYVSFGAIPEACAEFDLRAQRCDIWFSKDFPPSRYVIEHERLHCAGYDHVGSTDMQRFLAQQPTTKE